MKMKCKRHLLLCFSIMVLLAVCIPQNGLAACPGGVCNHLAPGLWEQAQYSSCTQHPNSCKITRVYSISGQQCINCYARYGPYTQTLLYEIHTPLVRGL